ncbi:hypothetical protein [Paracoccus denitrificans]|uniref:hypothetical protein n=1 Tax=Paracoccus denitrificans TaxID=266 RepID=UPI003364E13B
MSRRPVDQIAQSRDAEGRQVIWEAIRAQNAEFVSGDLFNDTWINRYTIRSYLNSLAAAGILEKIEHPDRVGQRDSVTWRLMKDEGFYAPRVNRKGERVTQGLGVEQMWRAMRIMKEFKAVDLALHATTDEIAVSIETAKSYCTMLLACGYLACIQKANAHRQATYRLVRNSGPLAPQIQRVKQVFDPNSKTVYRKGEA